ncbi:transmembrane protein 273 isoform X2 [Ascaphus truei]|uniref:transmembrane protein 273 isoform X2 n=1 Tax=Ascaphus truei TaxID=8439 RepID=UPI003F59CB46
MIRDGTRLESKRYQKTKNCVCTEGSDEELDVRYALIGAGVGALLGVSFIAIKLYMIKKHMMDNHVSDCDSFPLKHSDKEETQSNRQRDTDGKMHSILPVP